MASMAGQSLDRPSSWFDSCCPAQWRMKWGRAQRASVIERKTRQVAGRPVLYDEVLKVPVAPPETRSDLRKGRHIFLKMPRPTRKTICARFKLTTNWHRIRTRRRIGVTRRSLKRVFVLERKPMRRRARQFLHCPRRMECGRTDQRIFCFTKRALTRVKLLEADAKWNRRPPSTKNLRLRAEPAPTKRESAWIVFVSSTFCDRNDNTRVFAKALKVPAFFVLTTLVERQKFVRLANPTLRFYLIARLRKFRTKDGQVIEQHSNYSSPNSPAYSIGP